MVAVQAENMVELFVTAGDEARLLALLRLEVQVSQVLDVLEPGSTVIINEPTCQRENTGHLQPRSI